MDGFCRPVILECPPIECSPIEVGEFGACEAVLGFGPNADGECVTVSGCDCNENCDARVFDTLEACQFNCGARPIGHPCGGATADANISITSRDGAAYEEGGPIGFVWGPQGGLMIVLRTVLAQTGNVNLRAELVQNAPEMRPIGIFEFASEDSPAILRCAQEDDAPQGWGTDVWLEFSQSYEADELVGMDAILRVSVTYQLDNEMRTLEWSMNGILELD